jgi:alpha-L-fucosidase
MSQLQSRHAPGQSGLDLRGLRVNGPQGASVNVFQHPDMKTILTSWLAVLAALLSWSVQAVPNNPNTDWFKDARMGAFMHFLPASSNDLKLVDQFDVEGLANQLESMGAKYFVLTLGQNSGFFNSPNATYDRIAGFKAGERCATRDLPADVAKALQKKGIRLMLYLPCQTPNQDRQAQKAFGINAASGDQPVNLEFASKWASVIQEWSDRYGENVAGWWFDGGYAHIQFNNAIAEVYAKAVKHGNPKAIVTFNPGVRVAHYTAAEDYTAGELDTPFDQIPASRWLDGSQWHALTFVGSFWGRRDTRIQSEAWARWVRTVTDKGGVITLDMGPNYDPAAGPIGSFAPEQVRQVQAIHKALTGSQPMPKRLSRADSFLGIHFDFHAGPDCKEIGKNTTREMIESIIDQVHPDYIQTDCKGHPGLSSYPTLAGNQAPGFVGNPLRLWREVTAERGVSLYMHYSGVWDSRAITLHPDWAVTDGNGSANPNATSFFGPYAEKLLIPQLRELAGEYGVDGAWVDGECWASAPDFGAAAVKAFQQSTGITNVPHGRGDAHWFEFLQFHREAFRNYLRHYVSEVKKTNPEMQLCSNWAFTDHMPDPVSAPIDFISGDYSPQDSVNSARVSARYIAQQGKPWDLMAWSFTTMPGPGGNNHKSVPQLQREAAAVLALGGGFQAYFTQNRDGSVRTQEMAVMAEVAKFCRARQAVCHHAVQVPQVALLYSSASHYRRMDGLFNRDHSSFQGTLQALLDSQYSVSLVSEHHLVGKMSQYPVIIVPECDYLEPAFRQELVDYATNGGNLILVGPQSVRMFEKELAVTSETKPALDGSWILKHHAPKTGAVAAETQFSSKALPVIFSAQCQLVDTLASTNKDGQSLIPASIVQLGKGQISGVYFEFSRNYMREHNAAQRAFLGDLVKRLFSEPMVEVTGSHNVDVVVNRIQGHLAVNLVNTAGPHETAPIFDSIPAVGPLQVAIRQAAKPQSVTLEPGGENLAYDYQDGVIRLTLPKLEIHDVILVK